MGSNHGNLQNTPLLALGYRALRELPRCTVRGEGERGSNTGGAGLRTAGMTVREGQRGRPAGTARLGAEQAIEEGRKNSDPVVEYVQPYQEAYGRDGAD